MTTQSIVCGSCKAAVPYGRLSCPTCGELLASVAGSRRVVAGAVTPKGTVAQLSHAGSNGRAATPSMPAVPLIPSTRTTSAVRPVPSVLTAVPAEETVIAPPADPDDEPLYAASASPPDEQEPPYSDEPDWDDGPIGGAAVAPPSYGDTVPPSRREPAVLMAVETDPTPPPPAPRAESAPIASVESVATGWTPSTTMSAVIGSSAPGAYVPPPPMPAIPSGPAAPARGWAGHADTAAAAAASPAASASAAALPTRLAEFVRWLAVAGSTLAAVGFLLPMASSVIGSTGVGYLDRWGLAGPFHIAVVLGLLAVLALALAVDRVPLWIRVGLPGLGLGSLLIGLVWPYLLVSQLDAGPGAVAILVGAILLGSAGVIALTDDRHRSPDRAV